MISVIICSINPQLLTEVKQNIAETIGVPFEVIAIDNRNTTAGICEVYNRGVAQARFELLCFMHEDIIIQTKSWGTIVSDLLKIETGIGLIGVAGSYYKPLIPSSWNGTSKETECIYIMQGSKQQGPGEFLLHNTNPLGKNQVEVASVDGVWLCTTKAIALANAFDADTLKGFHCYDIDFSLSVGRSHKVIVTYEILLAHLSDGNFDRTWLIETLKLHDKWKAYLPVLRGELSMQKRNYIEKYTFRHLLRLFKDCNLPISYLRKMLWQPAYFKSLPVKLWINMNFHLYKFHKNTSKSTDYRPLNDKELERLTNL